MSWFKKKEAKFEDKGGLGELPELPPLPEFSANKTELPVLPSFPSSSFGEKMTNEIVKQTIKEPLLEEETEESIETEIPVKKLTREFDEERIEKPKSASRAIKIAKVFEEEPILSEYQTPRQTKSIEPIFIRIDKYQDAISDLRNVRKVILEIEAHLKDVKEIRTREEAELQRWEDEIKEAKDKLNEIDSSIFQKLE